MSTIQEIPLKDVRRLTEMAYMHAWGPEGNGYLRDEFKKIQIHESEIGKMLYLGDGKFRWIPKRMP